MNVCVCASVRGCACVCVCCQRVLVCKRECLCTCKDTHAPAHRLLSDCPFAGHINCRSAFTSIHVYLHVRVFVYACVSCACLVLVCTCAPACIRRHTQLHRHTIPASAKSQTYQQVAWFAGPGHKFSRFSAPSTRVVLRIYTAFTCFRRSMVMPNLSATDSNCVYMWWASARVCVCVYVYSCVRVCIYLS